MSSTILSATAQPLRLARPRSVTRRSAQARPVRAASVRTQARPHPVRLTRRGRVVILLLVLLAATAATLFGRGQVQATSSSTGPVVGYVTVQPGETLWEIASDSAPGQDPRAMVDRIIELNNLTDAGVLAGQRLAVPAQA